MTADNAVRKRLWINRVYLVVIGYRRLIDCLSFMYNCNNLIPNRYTNDPIQGEEKSER